MVTDPDEHLAILILIRLVDDMTKSEKDIRLCRTTIGHAKVMGSLLQCLQLLAIAVVTAVLPIIKQDKRVRGREITLLNEIGSHVLRKE